MVNVNSKDNLDNLEIIDGAGYLLFSIVAKGLPETLYRHSNRIVIYTSNYPYTCHIIWLLQLTD